MVTMPNKWTWPCVLYVLSMLSLCNSSRECHTLLSSVVSSADRPVYKAKNATLEVDWTQLDRQFAADGCQYDSLEVELWRTAKSYRGNDNWGRNENMCQRLDIDRFVLHDIRRHNFGDAEPTHFSHVVEPVNHILRVCICKETECNCGTSEMGPVCSDLIPINPDTKSKVFKWCQSEEDDSLDLHIHAPVINCTGVRLTGIMTSCTPIQDYDVVTIRLHPRQVENRVCDTHDHESKQVIILTSGLHGINDTHGRFDVSVPSLKPELEYCIGIELRDHPYCQLSDVTLAGRGHRPAICSSHVLTPMQTSKCIANTHVAKVSENMSTDRLAVIISLIALVFIVTVGIIIYYVFCKKDSKYCKHYIHEVLYEGADEVKEPMIVVNVNQETKGNIVLLTLPDSEEVEQISGKLREWISGLGFKVFDFGDESQSESISSHQENWMQSILESSSTRVILVDTDLAQQVLSDETPEAPLNDNFFDLRCHALRRVHAAYAVDYKHVCVVSLHEDKSGNRIRDINPMRRIVLPENLEAVEEWLLGRLREDKKTDQVKEALINDVQCVRDRRRSRK